MIWPARCNIYQQIKKMIDHASLIMSHFVISKFPIKFKMRTYVFLWLDNEDFTHMEGMQLHIKTETAISEEFIFYSVNY